MYTALYRQYRPDTFKDVVGQETIVRTLKNQLFSRRIAHAYLFNGSRGTGKTTTAQIFSRAINCEAPTENGPCGVCKTCINLSSGNNMDIIEIDAASNNGVDEIRDLRDKVRFPPAFGKYKVYIIDEVHMLSIGAFNALLKTLEEPPEHVVFILATTEPHKLPATILSRCQRYDFKRISLRTLVDRMKVICDDMSITVEEAGLFTIARWAEGGMRDALSLLDQCIGFCGNDISNEDVLSVLGTSDQSFIFNAADDIVSGNAKGLLYSIDKLIDDGKDLNVFLRDIVQHLRNLLIVKFCDDPSTLLDAEAAALERLKGQAQAAGEARLIRGIETLSSLESELKWSTQPRVLFELAVVKVCRPQQEDSMEALLDRIDQLEKRLKNGVVVKGANEPSVDVDYRYPDPPPVSLDDTNVPYQGYDMEEKAPVSGIRFSQRDLSRDRSDTGGYHKPVENQNSDLNAGAVSTVKQSESKNPVDAWSDVLKAIKKERMPIYTFLKDVKPRLDNGSVLTLMFSEGQGFFIAAIEKEENKTFVEEIVQRMTGHSVRVKCQVGEEESKDAAKNEDDDYVVNKAIDVFGEEFVEVIDE